MTNNTINRFKKIDLAFLLTAISATIFMVFELFGASATTFSISFGVMLYGVIYFHVLEWPSVKSESQHLNFYFSTKVKAHLAQHSPRGKYDYKNFSLLIYS